MSLNTSYGRLGPTSTPDNECMPSVKEGGTSMEEVGLEASLHCCWKLRWRKEERQAAGSKKHAVDQLRLP